MLFLNIFCAEFPWLAVYPPGNFRMHVQFWELSGIFSVLGAKAAALIILINKYLLFPSLLHTHAVPPNTTGRESDII